MQPKSRQSALPANYLHVSAYGAQFFLQSQQDKNIKAVLQLMLSLNHSVTLTELVGQLKDIIELPLAFILDLHEKGYLTSSNTPMSPVDPIGLSSILDGLSYLSLGRKTALADAQGFQLAQCGFEDIQAEQLCALSVEVLDWQRRRQSALTEITGSADTSLSIVNKKGKATTGFWPIYIGDQTLVLILQGRPRFDHDEFCQLLYLLGNHFL